MHYSSSTVTVLMWVWSHPLLTRNSLKIRGGVLHGCQVGHRNLQVFLNVSIILNVPVQLDIQILGWAYTRMHVKPIPKYAQNLRGGTLLKGETILVYVSVRYYSNKIDEHEQFCMCSRHAISFLYSFLDLIFWFLLMRTD